jgi:hypothetical protein
VPIVRLQKRKVVVKMLQCIVRSTICFDLTKSKRSLRAKNLQAILRPFEKAQHTIGGCRNKRGGEAVILHGGVAPTPNYVIAVVLP